MPGFSRTGPHGEEPKTGWGRDYCGTSTRNTGKGFGHLEDLVGGA